MALTKRTLEYLFFVGLVALAMLCAWAPSAFAGYLRDDQPRRPAVGSQQVLPEYQWVGSSTATPILTNATYIVASTATPHTTGLTVTTFAHQPDVARNLTVTPAGTTADVTACTVTITGKSVLGKTISETFSIGATQSTATVGNKAFQTVTSISIPAACETGTNNDTSWHVGVGAKLGLNRCLDFAGDFGHASFGGVKETTAPTIAASATAVESNTATLNSALDGAHTVRLLYYQNYRCLP
jgi:hypothetical protein